MKPEDLFQAIGAVEEARLARSDWQVSSEDNQEDKIMKMKPRRVFRNLLIAAVLVSMLAVTAYAVTGFLIFNSPEEIIAEIFGDQTGFDHKEVTQHSDPGKPGSLYDVPGYDRVPADETVVAEDIAPHVDFVGKTISSSGYTLTVDAYMYDSVTKCGFVTYLLENPEGVSGYSLQPNGEIWYPGGPDIVQVNQYGYPHIIQEKTTDTCLAATYYFRDTGFHGDELILSLPFEEEPRTIEEIDTIRRKLDQEIRRKLTPEEALEKAKELVGEAIFAEYSRFPDIPGMTPEQWEEDCAYNILRDRWYQEEYEQKGPSITIPMEGDSLKHMTAGKGAIVISPISFQLDVTGLGEPWKEGEPDVYELLILYQDGSEYEVLGELVDNTIFRLVDSATEGREDLHNRYTCMFNRIIDVDSIAAVEVNGQTVRPE